MADVHTYYLTVPAAAIDANGHVGNVEYLRWLMDAAEDHATCVGWPTDRCRAQGATWVVRRHEIHYLRPAFAGERLAVQTWVASLSRAQSQRQYRIWRPADAAELARGATDYVFFDLERQRPRLIPRELITAFPIAGVEPSAPPPAPDHA